MLKNTENPIVAFAASLFILNNKPFSDQKFNSITKKNGKKLIKLYEDNNYDEIAKIYKLQPTGKIAIVRKSGVFTFYPVIDNKLYSFRRNAFIEAKFLENTDITVLNFGGESFTKEASNDE